VEMTLTGQMIGRWQLDEFHHVRAGLTDDGHVYVQKGNGPSDSALYTLDRATSSWKPVAEPTKGYFCGVDGIDLVFWDWAEGPCICHGSVNRSNSGAARAWYPRPTPPGGAKKSWRGFRTVVA
jgi:hypothetical protein